MKASDFIATFIKSKGITCVFELSGGMITHMLDSIHKLGGIDIVTMHHEQSASFAVDGFARMFNKPGIAMATSGPGATNLLTGIASCFFDSVPGLFLTGQVNIHEQKGTRAIRQLGFQETDIVSMSLPITKASFRVTSAQELPDLLEMAYRLTLEGRPGPVLIDIPMNVQREIISENALIKKEEPSISNLQIPEKTMDELIFDLQAANRPLILAGRGIRSSQSHKEFTNFINQVNIPVVNSLLGLDTIPFNHPMRAGFIGAYGNRWANLAIGQSDLILVLGSRLDIRQTGADTRFFESNRKIYHVDCESGEINNRLNNCIPILAHLPDFFKAFSSRSTGKTFFPKSEWLDEIDVLRKNNSDLKELGETPGINPNDFMHRLSAASGKASAYLADVGNHQMWAAQSLELNEGQSFITSGGMGAMGHAFPAAIGVYFASKKPVVVISGDGGFQLNIQELQTVFRNQIPLKIIIINNKNLGMIRQFQDSYFESRYQSTFWGYSPPDFEKVAEAYGIEAATISETHQISEALTQLWSNPQKPFLLQVMVDSYANAYPKIAFGKPLTEMEPDFKPLEMEGT